MVTVSTQTLWSLPPLQSIETCPTPMANECLPMQKAQKFHSQLIQRYKQESSCCIPEQCIVSSPLNSSLNIKLYSNESSTSASMDAHQPSMPLKSPKMLCTPSSSSIPTSEEGSKSLISSRAKPALPAVELLHKRQLADIDCQVCGDVSSGFHCGAYVCEACKKFYTRACKQGQGAIKFKCNNEAGDGQACVINKTTRALCQLCRYNKCISVGMLPPGSNLIDTTKMADLRCRVCGSSASGFHFGTLSCESCKSFFRRFLKNKTHEPPKCKKEGKCAIELELRSDCKACRYHKCVQTGMSTSLIRVGRQPNSVRHSRIVENKPEKLSQETKMDSSISATTTPVEVNATVSIAETHNIPDSSVMRSSSLSSGSIPFKSVPSDHPLSASLSACPSEPHQSQSSSSQILDLSLPSVDSGWINRIEQQKVYYKQLVDSLDKDWSDLVVELRVAPLTNYEFIATVFKRFNSFLFFILEYLKQTKGFSQIGLNDRITMAKSAVFRNVLLVGASHYNLETGRHVTFVLPSHTPESARYYELLPEMKQSARHFDQLGRTIKLLDFSHEELCLMVFLNTTNQDNLPKFKNSELVETLSNEYYDLLKIYLATKYKDPSKRLADIQMVLRACSDATYEHTGVAQTTCKNHAEYVSAAPEVGYEAIPMVYSEVYSP